ncbi:unnamed protein product [marine sediment metagenome]|uniref:Uncharacterized protein n=1 Tax=marine sediment metagenome TaxID=412755 RepID=X1S5W0_9ZZZZ
MTEKEFIKKIESIDWEIDILKKKREILIEIFCRTNAKFLEGDQVYWSNMPVFIRGIHRIDYSEEKVNIYYSIGSLLKSGEMLKDSYLGNVPENQLSKYKNS